MAEWDMGSWSLDSLPGVPTEKMLKIPQIYELSSLNYVCTIFCNIIALPAHNLFLRQKTYHAGIMSELWRKL